MSATTKKKHVFLETINNYSVPTDTQTIVRVSLYKCSKNLAKIGIKD